MKQLREERDILKKAATWFAREAESTPSDSHTGMAEAAEDNFLGKYA